MQTETLLSRLKETAPNRVLSQLNPILYLSQYFEAVL
jgi:hypothetical protein